MMNEPTGLRQMAEAPETASWVVLWYRDGINIYPVAAHWACGGGEEQPPFKGWFRWTCYLRGGFTEAPSDPIGWTLIEGAEMRA